MAIRYFSGEKAFFEAVFAYNLNHHDHKMVTRSEYYLDRNTDGEVIQTSPNLVKRVLAPFYLHGVGENTLYLLKDEECPPEVIERHFDATSSAYLDWLPNNREVSWLGYMNGQEKGSGAALSFMEHFINKERASGPIVLCVLGNGIPRSKHPLCRAYEGMGFEYQGTSHNPISQNIYSYILQSAPAVAKLLNPTLGNFE